MRLQLAAGAAFLAMTVQAHAMDLEGEAAVVSDYRFRGVSLSDRQPALQAGLTASAADGLYASVWGSTIDEYGQDAGGRGATVEMDYAVGWAFAAGGYDLDAGVAAYTYPHGLDVNYLEIPVSVSRAAGPWRWTLGGAYAPAQKALGDDDNLYGWGGLAWGGEGPTNVEVRVGYEDGAYAPGGKWDWSAAVSHGFGRAKVGLTYVDTNRAAGGAGLVASVGVTF